MLRVKKGMSEFQGDIGLANSFQGAISSLWDLHQNVKSNFGRIPYHNNDDQNKIKT